MIRIAFILCLVLSLIGCRSGHADDLEEVLSLIEGGRLQEALPRLEKLVPKLRDATDRNVARYALGLAYERLERWEDAIEVFQAALDNGIPVQDHPQWHIAESYEALEDLEHAAQWYRRLLNEHPQSSRASEAALRLAEVELSLERYASVLAICRGRQGRQVDLLRAQAYEGLKDWKQAYRHYQRVLESNPSDNLAEDAYERILIVLGRARTIHPTRSERLAQAKVLLAARQYTEARQILRKIVGNHRDKLAGQATYLIAQSYANQRKYDAAIREYAKIRDRYSASGYLTRALYQSALLYRRKGYITKGNRLLLEFVKTYSWSALADNALYEVGQSEQKRRRYRQAIEAYQKLLRQYTRSSLTDDALWNLGWCYFKLGELRQSQRTFQQLARRFPGTDLGNAAQFWLAKIEERLGHPRRAIPIYRQIIEEGDWYYACRAEQRLRALRQQGVATKITLVSTSPLGKTPAAWQTLQQSPLPQIPFLFRARAYEDALRDLQSALRNAGEKRAAIYYHLILCSEKLQRYRQASLYAYRLSRLDGWHDAQGRLPEPLFRRIYPLYYANLIRTHAAEARLDPLFVAAMIREESRYQSDIVSHAGAIGLMQLMPATARDIARRLKIRPFHTAMLTRPEISIRLGTWYMGKLMEQFRSLELVSGAYNGGPGRIERWTKELAFKDLDEFIEDIPIPETRNHIKRVMHSYAMYKRIYGEMGKG